MRLRNALGRRTTVWMAAAAVAGLSACASGGGQPPAETPSFPNVSDPATGSYRPGKFVWYDLVTPDLESSKRFYGDLLGWSFETGPDSLFTLVTMDDRLIGGMFDLTRTEADPEPGHWFSSVSVVDVDAAARAFAEAGGRVLTEPRELPNRGRYAVVTDDQGAEIVLLRATGGDPLDRDAVTPGEFLWTELWTRDAAAAVDLYADILGYTAERTDGERSYYVMSVGDRPRAGVGQLPPDLDVDPAWLPYIAVRSAEDIAARVVVLGGEVVITPEATRNGTAAVIVDPSGAAFAVQEWPAPSEGESER